MGVLTFTDDIKSPVAASRLFKAMVLEADTLLPKIVPQAIRNVEVVQGNGGPGTIEQINFPEGSPFKYVKHRVDALDKENMTYAYTMVEGDALLGKLESISYELKLNSAPDGGSIGKNVSTCHTKPGVEIKEEEIKGGKNMAEGIFKAVEAYLLANPDA
ncbi:Major allergen Pru ar 1 [Heracleum sosnowskyi]|uniref:Major allergen Pru ar 1 n=1 Tax=Heracleum sosnowskyi TaxID=360622 RepID=A0AAD8MUI0_9APIA|nr:Major allergen Pru ar 1 [Heracleum sosnowskyi]